MKGFLYDHAVSELVYLHYDRVGKGKNFESLVELNLGLDDYLHC